MKPATIFAPVAVTPAELGDAWQDGRIHLDMQVSRNGEWFGNPDGREMDWSFGELLAHLAFNRNLRAGTVLGSGSVSNRTPTLQYGDYLRFEVHDDKGQSIFGDIEHRIVPLDYND